MLPAIVSCFGLPSTLLLMSESFDMTSCVDMLEKTQEPCPKLERKAAASLFTTAHSGETTAS